MLRMIFTPFVVFLITISLKNAESVARPFHRTRFPQPHARPRSPHKPPPGTDMRPVTTYYTWMSESSSYARSSYKPPSSSSSSYGHPTTGTNHTTPTPTSGSDQDRWLAAHNKVRAQYGAPALTWDTTLEAFAKRATSTCVWKHTDNNQYGENIAAGQSSLEAVVSDWVEGADEKASYAPSSPHYSHFTQVVWASSTQLGCAVTSCQELKGESLPQSPIPFYACEYNPPGNVQGEYAQNVKALQGGAPAVKT